MPKRSKKSSKISTVLNKRLARDKYLQKTYGISLVEYEIKRAEQNYSCAICGKHESVFKKSLHVDHNHKTSRVRGLLCYYCNRRLIGRHTIDSASKVLHYLLKYDLGVRLFKDNRIKVWVE